MFKIEISKQIYMYIFYENKSVSFLCFSKIRNEIEMIQMTMKNIENEILILDHSLDKNVLAAHSFGLGSSEQSESGRVHCEKLKAQKEHSLEDAKRMHEDLEFQLMELEAKYETELEDIQNRLIKEQDSLLNAFKQRQSSLNEYDQHQTQMLMQVKAETECLEMERQKLIDTFKKVICLANATILLRHKIHQGLNML